MADTKLLKIMNLNLLNKYKTSNERMKENVQKIRSLGFKYIKIRTNYAVLTFCANGPELLYYMEMPDGIYKITEDYKLRRIGE